MDIYLIRHTQTAVKSGICYGQTDVPLAASFADELAVVKDKLPDIAVETPLISSPLSRCLLLAQQLSNNVITDHRLAELHFGDWEGCRFDQIDSEMLRNWTENFVDTPPPNGESFADLHHRLSEFWRELIQLQHERIMIVTHAGAIRALLAHILELPLANAFRFQIGLGSVHKLRYLNNYVYIDSINQ